MTAERRGLKTRPGTTGPNFLGTPRYATPEEAADAKVGQLLSDADVPLSADESMAEGIGELLDERLRELDAGEVPLVSSGVVHARLMALATENIVKAARSRSASPAARKRERSSRTETRARTAGGRRSG